MATYRLLKENKIINIIEADEDFIEMLKKEGSIDNAVNVADLNDPKPLIFDEKKQSYVENINFREPIEIPKIKPIDVEKMSDEVTKLKDDFVKLNAENLKKVGDVQDAIIAIKGFLMILPDMQKTLLDIKESLADNNNIKQ